MILADTSVWVDHLRARDARLAELLNAGRVAGHPLVVAEVALGSLRERSRILGHLDALPDLPLAEPEEIRALVERRALFGRGIGYVGASLLASCLLARGTRVWTRDRKLHTVATEIGIAFS